MWWFLWLACVSEPDVVVDRDAVLRGGQPEALLASMGSELRWDVHHPVVDQVVLWARQDPAVGWADLERAVADCAVLDAQPSVGRKPLDLPVPPRLLEAASVLGAGRVIIGATPNLRKPNEVGPPLRCHRREILGAIPDHIARTVVLAVDVPTGPVYLELRQTKAGPWIFATSDPSAAARWIEAALSSR